MHLVYSASQNTDSNIKATVSISKPTSRTAKLRYRGYQAACQKYKHEIAAIQQYMPGWQPAFK
jgi:hypothetical protein